jgi:5-methylcytosine-specific restriction endonuclease McrA
VKRCKKCGEVKPLDDFYRNPGGKDGRRPECKACTGARRKLWYQANRQREVGRVVAWQQRNRERYNAKLRAYRRANPEAGRADHLNRAFGLTIDGYESLLKAQGGGCAICGRRPAKISLHVDHDHETNEVRGLLCFRCNGGLGPFKENVERLLRAVDYLEGGAAAVRGERTLVTAARRRSWELRRPPAA